MTNLITLTIPNDDHIALRAFGKALEEMALAHGAEPVQLQTYCNVTMNDEQNDLLRQKLKNVLGEPRDGNIDVTRAMVEQCAPIIDTTAQQVESLQGKRKEPEATVTTSGIIRVKESEVDTTEQQYEVLQEHVKTKHIELVTSPFIDTDKTGTPWDERIHSTSKALNADGTWRLRRKPKDMDELEWSDYVSMIKADLQYPVECGGEKEESAGGDSEFVVDPYDTYEEGELPPVVTVEPPVTPLGDDFHTDAGVVTEQTVAGIPPLPVPPPVVVAPPVTEWDFPRLMTFLTERHGKIDVATVNTLLAQDGMLSVQELNAHPDKIGPFVARVKAHLGE